jgi:uncharacterized SAM-binding protein YcdF (DUF218 family)
MDFYKFWTVSDNPPKHTDCFIILSYAVEDIQTPTVPTKATIQLVSKWRNKFPHASVIMSTGDNQKLGVPNSKVMVEYAEQLGIPKRYLIEEGKSWSTYENLICSKEIIDKKKFTHVTLVLYDLHVRRTLAVAAKLGWKNFSWISISSQGSPAYGWKYVQTYSRLTIFLYELLAYVYNWLRGEL